MGRHAIAAYLIFALLASVAMGQQESPPPKHERKKPVSEDTVIEYSEGAHWQEGGYDVAYLTGQVKVVRGEIEITAARAMVWKKTGPEQTFEELYAEGNVVLKRGSNALRAERLYFNFKHDKAFLLDVEAEGYNAELRQRFYLKAREARMTARGRLEADDVTVSTCSYGVPHYHMAVRHMVLAGDAPDGKQDRYQVFSARSGWRVEGEDVYPEIVGAPLFFFPSLTVGPWLQNFPIRSIEYGNSSRFGSFIYTEFGMKITKMDGDRGRKWGEVIAEADWRQERGWAWGLDLKYGWHGYNGYLDTYFLHDLGRNLDVDFESKFPPLDHPERGRARFFHRQELDAHWRFELEASYVSDRSLIEEFFEREFKEGKEQETAAYMRWIDGPMGGYILERHRLNNFQTQNEFLPRAHFDIFGIPVLEALEDHVYLTERVDMSHIRRRFDDDLQRPPEEVWRLDSVSDLTMPLDLGVLQVSPFVEHRSTVYDDDLEGQTDWRALWSAGGRLSTQIHATHPSIGWEFIGLRGVRHVMELEARYASTLNSSVPPSDLFPFEDTERLDRFEEVSLEMRHRLLTRDEANRVFEWLNVGAQVEYYPDPARDTISRNVNNYLPPFNWIPLAPSPGGSTFLPRHWSNIHLDGTFSPRNFLHLGAEDEYNPETQEEEARQIRASATVLPWANVTASHTFIRDVTDADGLEVSLKLADKWLVYGLVQYDFRANAYVTQSVTVSRDYHDFLVELVVEHDFGRDERRFYVSVVPNFIGRRSPQSDVRTLKP